MKKMYTAALALLLSLYGCSAAPEINEFEGVITKKVGSSVTVESIGGAIPEGNLVSFSSANLADNGAEVGDTVTVTFDGKVLESYPLQISASGWDIVPQSSAGTVSMSLSAITPEGCKVTFINNRDSAYHFFGYGIQKVSATGEWELIGGKYFDAESSWTVDSGCSTEIKINWKNYCGALPEGSYRLVYQYLANTDGADKALLLFAEFTV